MYDLSNTIICPIGSALTKHPLKKWKMFTTAKNKKSFKDVEIVRLTIFCNK